MTSNDPDPYEDGLSMTRAEFDSAIKNCAIMTDEYREFIMIHSALCDFMDLEMSSNQLETIHDKPFGVTELLGETHMLFDEGGAISEVGIKTYLSSKEGEAHLVAKKEWGGIPSLTGKDEQEDSCTIMKEVLAEMRKNKKAPKDDSFTAITWACNLKLEKNELRGKEFSRHWSKMMNEEEVKFLVDFYPKGGGPSRETYMLVGGQIEEPTDNDLIAKRWYAKKKAKA